MASNEQIPSVWTRRPGRRRKDQPALSQEQIVGEAIKLLDAEGIDGLSMRRLGTELGAVATAIYWHVANKDELIELVVDEVYGEMAVPEIERPDQWRQAATECAHSLRAMFLRHPWMVSVLDQSGVSHLGPNLMRMSDDLLGLFHTAGFPLMEADRASTTLIAYVAGVTNAEAALLNRIQKHSGEQDWFDNLWPAAEQAAQAYPRLRELYAEYSGADHEKDRTEAFDYGLDRVLDGLQVKLSQA